MGRRSRSAARAVFIGALLLACGARTGLGGEDLAELEPITPDAGTSSDAEADADPPVGCQDGTFVLRRASPAVMFVLDRSLSMRVRLASGATRWNTLTRSLEGTLPPVDDSMEIGALIYPVANGTSQSCSVAGEVDLAPGFGNVGRLTSLLRANGPRGSTPTADAIDRAASVLLGFRAATRARAMVLATDGEPTCNPNLDGRTCVCVDGRCGGHPIGCRDDVRTAERLAHYRDQGLPTYVIGIQDEGEAELADVLDRLAVAGGRPQSGARRFYEAASQSELDRAFETIRDEVGQCTYLTTSVPGAEGTIVVSIDGAPAREGTYWTWSNRANGEILFAGGVCSYTSSGDLTVDVRCNSGPVTIDAATRD